MLLRYSLWIRWMALIFVLLVAVILVLWKFYLVSDVPFRLDYPEGFVYLNTLTSPSLDQIYRSTEKPPYTFGYYTPGYFFVTGLLFDLLGSSITLARGVTFAALLATAVLCAGFVYHRTNDKFRTVLVFLLLVGSYLGSHWGMLIRPDMLALLFCAWGMWQLRDGNKSSARIFVISALLFAGAFFVKQNMIVAPIAVGLWLGLNKEYARLRLFLLIYGVALVVGIALLSLVTGGEFFKQTFIYSGDVEYRYFYPAFRVAALTLISALPLLLISAVQIIRRPRDLLSVYFVVSLLTFLMLVREGGTTNYLLEFLLALILISSVSEVWPKIIKLPFRLFVPVALILNVCFVLWCYSITPWELKTYIAQKMAIVNNYTKMISSIDSEVLVEDPLLLINLGKTVWLEPFTFVQMVKSGNLSIEPFNAEISRGTYPLLIDEGSFGGFAVYRELLDKYYRAVYVGVADERVKPYDYGIYNRNTYQDFGTVYEFIGVE